MVDTMSVHSEIPDKSKPTNKFSKNILKSYIGLERASNAIKTLSMVLPSKGGLATGQSCMLDSDGKYFFKEVDCN